VRMIAKPNPCVERAVQLGYNSGLGSGWSPPLTPVVMRLYIIRFTTH
jgi:hypothetical protein